MLRTLSNVIFGLVAAVCLAIALFWVWFLYEYSVKWQLSGRDPLQDASARVVFGAEGAWWIGAVAAGWFILALLLAFIQWRVRRKAASDSADS